jgi:hypothetical protein
MTLASYNYNPYSIVKEALIAKINCMNELTSFTRLIFAGSCVSRALMVGGADRDRTDDPLLAKQMLSQLSYSPGGRRSGGIEN